MFQRFLSTSPSVGITVLRIIIASIMIYHGGQKLGLIAGGFGIDGTVGFFGNNLGVPAFITYLVIIGEFFGGIAMLLGLFTRFTAASWIVIMLGALFLVHMAQVPEKGFAAVEFQLLLLATAVTLLISGGGCLSLDRLMLGKTETKSTKK